jgi:uncharacterized ParB-like nuclease family protein
VVGRWFEKSIASFYYSRDENNEEIRFGGCHRQLSCEKAWKKKEKRNNIIVRWGSGGSSTRVTRASIRMRW